MSCSTPSSSGVPQPVQTQRQPEHLQPPPIKSKEEFYITQVIYSRNVHRSSGATVKMYLVKWWGNYPKPTWEPQSQLTGCPILLTLHTGHMDKFSRWLEELNIARVIKAIKFRVIAKLRNLVCKYYKHFVNKFIDHRKGHYSNWELYYLFNYDLFTDACSKDRAGDEGDDNHYGTDDLLDILTYTMQPIHEFSE